MKYKRLAFPLGILLAMTLMMVLGPLIWRVEPNAMDFNALLAPPSAAHPMGTDSVGRDVLARFLAGGRLSLFIGLVVMLGGLIPGVAIGMSAAHFGGVVDMALMRIMDSIAAFPPILLAMAVAIGLSGGVSTAALGVSISTLPFFARLMRSEAKRINSYPFVAAARAMGATPGFILRWHIAPHAASTMLVQCAGVFGYSIIALAGLGFIGLGAKIPTAEWGLMITDGMKHALTGEWWLTIFPGLGILIAVFAANLTADRLSEALGHR